MKSFKIFFFVIFILTLRLYGNNSRDFNRSPWVNVFDNFHKIILDNKLKYDGKLFSDIEIGFKIIIPNGVFLEFSTDFFISSDSFFKEVFLERYGGKYFILISKNDLRNDYGKDVYETVLKKYKINFDNNKSSLLVYKNKIIGEINNLLYFKNSIQSPLISIAFVKNLKLVSIFIRYFPFNLYEMQNKYSHLLEISNEPDSIGELVWKKEVIKMIKEKSKDAPSELVKLYEIFQSVLNSLEFDDGKPEILWADK